MSAHRITWDKMMQSHRHGTEQPCANPNCRRMFVPKHWSEKYCSDDCRRAARLRQVRAYQIRNGKRDPGVTVIHDPLPILDGGFPAGATISKIELREMLNLGSFTPQTIIELGGQRSRVIGQIGQQQELVKL